MSICVHGLGYIGLATASLFANNGHNVIGFDVDEEVLKPLERGKSSTGEPEFDAYVERALADGLSVSRSPVPASYHLICVPTPYDEKHGEADLSYVEKAGRNIATNLEPGDTVVLESTVPPGTTNGLLRWILSKSGLQPGKDFHLCYTPETVMPGNTLQELRSNDRIVGGVDQASTDAGKELFEPVSTGDIHTVPDPTTAEFVKLAQNAARDVDIAYANTLTLLANDYDIDVRSAIELANNHPRVDILDPGPGVGGHCLPVDPLFLGEESSETALVDCARSVNDRMPGYVVDQLEETIGNLQNRSVAVLGVAYKANVSDTRNSPGLAIARHLDSIRTPPRSLADGGTGDVDVRIHDPNVDDSTLNLEPFDAAIEGADAAIIAAGHDEFAELDPVHVGEKLANRTVLDSVDLLDSHRWEEHGFTVISL